MILNQGVTSLFERIVNFLSGALIFLIGPSSVQIQFLGVILFGDIALGILLARKKKEFSCHYFIHKTLEKLVVYAVWIIIGHACDVMISLPNQIRQVIVTALFGQELLSLIKSTGELGYVGIIEPIKQAVGALLPNNKEAEDGKEDVKTEN